MRVPRRSTHKRPKSAPNTSKSGNTIKYRNFSPGADALDRLPLLDALRDHGVRTILDAGCGSGKLMWRLMQEHAGEFDVHGFDITDNCLDPCFADIKDRVLTIGCLWNPDDFKQVYDAVICCDVMEHIPTERVPAVLANLSKSAGGSHSFRSR